MDVGDGPWKIIAALPSQNPIVDKNGTHSKQVQVSTFLLNKASTHLYVEVAVKVREVQNDAAGEWIRSSFARILPPQVL